MTTRASAVLGASVLVLAGILGGCSDDGDDGGSAGTDFAEGGYDKVRDAAIEAMASVESLHVSLSLSGTERSSAVELSMSTDGSCTGTVTVDQTSTQVLRKDGEGWYKPNLALLEQLYPGKGEQAAKFVGEKWVVDKKGGVTEANCDLAALVGSLSDELTKSAGTSVAVTGEGSSQAVRLTYGEGGSGTALVQAQGEHYVVSTTNGGAFTTFSAFDEPIDTEAPAASDVVDLDDFKA